MVALTFGIIGTISTDIIGLSRLEFQTIVLYSHGTSVSYLGLRSLSPLPVQPSSIFLIYSLFYYMWLLARWDLFSSLQKDRMLRWDLFSSLQNIVCYLLMHYSVFE